MDDQSKSKSELIAELQTLRRQLASRSMPQAPPSSGAAFVGPTAYFEDAELLLTAVFEGAEEAIFIKDLESRYRRVNQVFCRVQGLDAEDLLGKTDREIFSPEDADFFVATDQEVLGSGKSKVFQGTLQNDRRLSHWICTKMPLRDHRGDIVGLLGFNRDVSHLVEARKALEERTLELEDFIDNATEGIHWVGGDGVILRANRTELELLGYEADEYVGRHISEFHADPDVIAEMLVALTSGRSLTNQPARLRAKDGSIKHVLINSNVAWRDGRFSHTRCFTRDVTERVRMEGDLRRLEIELHHAGRLSAVGELGAGIAHELHQPLTAMQMLVETMQLEPNRPISTIRKECSLISEQIFRMADIIDGIRDLARKKPPKLEPVSALWPVSRVVALLAEQMRQAGIDLVQDFPASAPPILADRGQLQQVFLNLLTNSLHALAEASGDEGEKTIRIGLQCSGDHVVFEVEDSGPGIAAEVAEQIFNPFFTTKDQDGTGLGLSLSRGIVRDHRGDLSFESSPGRGATFFVKIPTAESDGRSTYGAPTSR